MVPQEDLHKKPGKSPRKGRLMRKSIELLLCSGPLLSKKMHRYIAIKDELKNVLSARKEVLKDFLLLLFGEFTFSIAIVGYGGKMR